MKIEWKTRVQAVATFLLATAFLAWLADGSTDFVHRLPDALEAPVYALLFALGPMAAAYVAKHRASMLSDSATMALRERVRGREDWHPSDSNVQAVRAGIDRIKRRT